jgi:Fe2+ or Zn2+ uptake regulation protein
MNSAPRQLHQEAAARLASSGQRYTPTRRRLVDILSRAGTPLSLPDIVRGRKDLPQSSTYRNLAELETAGLIRRVASEDGSSRYELAEELTGHHHHLLCSSCGRVQDLHLPSGLERRLEGTLDALARESRFASVRHRLDLIGLCRSCAHA